MQVNILNLPWTLDMRLIKILSDGVTISFKDPDYTPESGGFHPVEVSISKDGDIQYITDFCYVGQPPMCDLCKSLDFDFSQQLFNYYGMDNPIAAGREVFTLFQSNFIAYHNTNAYAVEIEPW